MMDTRKFGAGQIRLAWHEGSRRFLIISSLFLLAACIDDPDIEAPEGLRPGKDRVALEILNDRVVVAISGSIFTEYRFRGFPVPIFYPLLDRTGAAMTRHFPIESLRYGEVDDHPHHRSLWYAHGSVNGHDFWHRGGTIIHESAEINAGDSANGFSARSRWVARDGSLIARDRRRFAFGSTFRGRFLDFEITLIASESDLCMGDTKEGTMAIRLTPTLRLQGKVAEGQALNSEGLRNRELWGKRAAWVDYSKDAEGFVYGVSIFDHPNNPRFPTWWHARDYGLVAANPFGIGDFEKRAGDPGEMIIPKGQSRTWRYRFYFHDGKIETKDIEDQYRSFASPR